jgi:CDP-diacylglycerol---glycerol-3-phosphate 3-phosphatidyltransferase
MNLANRLTLTRIGLIPFFVALALAPNVTSNPWTIAVCLWLALVVFVIAAITDYYDGHLARTRNMVTNFGQLFDPLADKLLTMAAFVVFVELRLPAGRPVLPAWAIILILGREFLVTGLRTLAISQGRLIQADRWGKHKTAWQLSCIISILVVLAFRATLFAAGFPTRWVDILMPWLCDLLLAAVIFFTVFSGAVYLQQNRDILREQP